AAPADVASPIDRSLPSSLWSSRRAPADRAPTTPGLAVRRAAPPVRRARRVPPALAARREPRALQALRARAWRVAAPRALAGRGPAWRERPERGGRGGAAGPPEPPVRVERRGAAA